MNGIEIKDVTHVYGSGRESVKSLDDISISLPKGEFLTVLGPSGCGKSTLLRLVGGFLNPTSGRILVDGSEIEGPDIDRGIIFQDYALFPWKTVIENVAFGVHQTGTDKETARKIAETQLDNVGLSGFENSYIKELSGGMKQRVSLARVLAYDPEYLLMDEPFGALDAQTREVLQEDLLEICSGTDKTILFITHNIEEAAYLGDRMIMMTQRPGRLKKSFEIDLDRTRNRNELMASEAFTSVTTEAREAVREEMTL